MRQCVRARRSPSGTAFGGRASWLMLASLAAGVTACSPKKNPERYYYDQHIQPIFNGSCVGNTSPCHRVDPATGVALGNLDLTSFKSVQKRRDVLRTYGSYPMPLLLLKAIPEEAVVIPYQGRSLQSEIRHAGGKPLSPGSDAFHELNRWLVNGANRDGIAPAAQSRMGEGGCNTALPADRDISTVDTSSQAYQLFIADVEPKLEQSCAFATCHSSPQSDFYITCGADDDQRRFNFLQAAGFVVAAPAPPEQSEILLRPLSPANGGVSHTGGIFFDSRADQTWSKWRDWAVEVQASPPAALSRSAGQVFFEENVMPKFLQRGCALEGCHSPNGFNDFRLRPGAQGFFAQLALKRNYETTLNEFMAVDSVDVAQSRAVKKTIVPSSGGIVHRGGAVLESDNFIVGTDTCPTPYDPATAAAFCTLTEWHRIERTDHAASVSAMNPGDTLPLVWIARPPDGDSPLQFDTFRGGADLMIADATLGARGAVTAVGTPRSLLAGCAGLTAGTADVRGPEFSYDATKVVFAGRTSATSGLDLWSVDVAGGACTRLTNDDGRMQGPVKVHNFDPVFAPDGTIVFASSRSGSLTPRWYLPNADLFRTGSGGDFTQVQQMTWLLASEVEPAFMQDGRLSFTAEKVSTDFYQLSGRRMNWDLTDYHPLLAQRAESTDTFNDTEHPSVGYGQATEIREGLDRNFLVILSNDGALGGGGALATFNRSVGPFEADRSDPGFLKSMKIIDPAATGVDGTTGVYRSPFSLPNGEILASYAANVANPNADTPNYRSGRGVGVGRAPVAGVRRGPLAGRGGARLQARRDRAVQEHPPVGVRRARRRQLRRLRRHAPARRSRAGHAAEREPAPWAERRLLRRGDRPARVRGAPAARAGQRRLGRPPADRDRELRARQVVEGPSARKEAAHPRAGRLGRQRDLHDARGAPGQPGRVHHPGGAAEPVQRHLRWLPRQPQRRGAGHRRHPRRADRGVGQPVARPGAEVAAVDGGSVAERSVTDSARAT